MNKAVFEFNEEILEFIFNKIKPDGRGGDIELDGNAIEHFIQNCNNFYLSDSIGILKDIILEVSLFWSNGKTSQWDIGGILDFDSKMNLPIISFIRVEEYENYSKVFIKFTGRFICKFSPSKTLVEQHKGWTNSIIELRLNFRTNFKKANNIDFGNVYCVIKDIQNQYNFVTDFI
jgi:hypothetical protein